MGDYPMRINKYLASKGYATRRGADEYIEKKKVFINGRLAKLGDKVNESDKVEVRKTQKDNVPYIYVAYHKPRGIITHSPQDDEDDIKALIDKSPELKGLFPIGRLDKDSSGLIILTNDGRVTDRLLNPESEHEKEYVVTTVRPLRASFKEYVEKGVFIEGYTTKPSKVDIRSESRFAITLTEGKKHQVRRMVVAMHNEVKNLERIRIMNIKLGNLPSGKHRVIEGEELQKFLTSLGL
jgi:23S rRNA pseudouridine2604 synthase